jgi:hypothetical protein
VVALPVVVVDPVVAEPPAVALGPVEVPSEPLGEDAPAALDCDGALSGFRQPARTTAMPRATIKDVRDFCVFI